MARAIAGTLGTTGLLLVVLRGLLFGADTNQILATGLVVFSIFASLGFCIGFIAQLSVRDLVENRFDRETTCRDGGR